MALTEELFQAFSADDTGDSHDDTMDLDFLVGVHDHLESETAEEAALDDLEQLLAALDNTTKDAENSIRSTADRRAAKKPRPDMEELREGLEARPVDMTRAICSICDEGFATTDELARHSKERYQIHAGHGINRTTVYVCLLCLKPWMDPGAVVKHVVEAHSATKKSKKNTKPLSAKDEQKTIDTTDPAAVLRHIKKIRLVRVFTTQAPHLMEVVQNEAYRLVQSHEESTEVNNCVIETIKGSSQSGSPDIKINISPKRPASKTSSVCSDEQKLLDLAEQQVLRVVNPEDEDDVIMIVMDENAEGATSSAAPEVNLSRASSNGLGTYILKDYNKPLPAPADDPIGKLRITSVQSHAEQIPGSTEHKHIFGFKKKAMMRAAAKGATNNSRLVLDAK